MGATQMRARYPGQRLQLLAAKVPFRRHYLAAKEVAIKLRQPPPILGDQIGMPITRPCNHRRFSFLGLKEAQSLISALLGASLDRRFPLQPGSTGRSKLTQPPCAFTRGACPICYGGCAVG